MKPAFFLSLSLSLIACLLLGGTTQAAETKPLKALLVAGGCCHDYAGQHKVLFEGIQARAHVQVDVWWTDDASVNPPLSLYENANWAEGYDIIIHDECAAGNTDLKVMKRILDVHQTVPAIHLHCAMHSFRNGTDQWFKHLGLQSSRHGPKEPIAIEFVDPEHPITASLNNWTTGNEELYNNVDIFDAHPLALGRQKVKGKEEAAVVAWTNEKQGARSFSTTIGHFTETVADDRYLNLVTRGLLWACDQLNDDYLGKPFTGKNQITFVKGKPKKSQAKSSTAASLGSPPEGATLVTVTAKSEQNSHDTWKAIDGDPKTRWCAENNSMPQWIQLEFDKPQKIYAASIQWESQNNAYAFTLESSMDGKPGSWLPLVDGKTNKQPGDVNFDFAAKDAKFVRVTVLGTDKGGWASIREIGLKAAGLTTLFPKLDEKQQATADQEKKAADDPYAKEGNVPPKIVKLSAEEEAEILKDVKVPEGFDVTLFSNSAGANYPVYVAASPNGDLYVSSDGNGSLGRDPHRGRVLRLRDTDNDGKADEVTEFVKDIDSPRGLVWDHDRLYLLHPPHITAFIDKDGDGVAEDSKRLIENIAFDFSGRPADHTTNGLELGIDGWLYIAGGDFGFMNATGTDGRTLQHRGGGVIRFRPDGSGLELFATGTRNILGTPTSPLIDLFARDNTNDGGGWDVRFHHFSGLEDHGYPRLYKNFGDEHVAPLADYGGGSGCGSVYIHEPGFPDEWKNAPFTCDWGTGALWRHSVERVGATFQEITAPQPFIKMTRPTDGDVDGMSAVYQASWKGATFKWEGPDVGYIARVTPKDYRPDPLPDFENMSDDELVAALESPSHIRTLAAQRALIRRKASPESVDALLTIVKDASKPLRSRVAALFVFGEKGFTESNLVDFAEISSRDDALAPFLCRLIGDHDPQNVDSEVFGRAIVEAGLQSTNDRAVNEAIIAVARQGYADLADLIAGYLLDDKDPVIAHTAFQALSRMGASDACFALLDDPDASAAQHRGAALALMRMHQAEVVDGLLSRLEKAEDPSLRQHLLAILCRLYHQEGEWTGDSWGTRPDTRGPYYQPETWTESEKIDALLKGILASAPADEASFLVKEMSRNRIQSNDALKRILTLATDNPRMVPEAVSQLATAESVPAEGIPILIAALKNPESDPTTVAQAVTALATTDSREGCELSLASFERLTANIATCQAEVEAAKKIADPNKQKSEGKYARTRLGNANKQLEDSLKAFLGAPKLENHHLLLETLSEADEGNLWADAGLLALASRKNGSPESRELSQKAIEAAWQKPAHRIRLMRAAMASKNRSLDDRILLALDDPLPEVAKAATEVAKGLKLKKLPKDKTPLVGSMKVEEAVAAVLKTKGDLSLGEQLFTKATCVACHTVSQDEPQKGPYLGNIAQTYPRPDLATAILDPNKTIAQGFASNLFTLKDGAMAMGFVTDEQGDQVTIRDIASQEHTFKKAAITKRDTLPTSMMPPGLMNGFTVFELASLLDFLEDLAKKK